MRTNSTSDEKSAYVEGQATGHAPETLVLKPRINLPYDELGQGDIVDTYCNESTGKMNTCGTYKDYK